MWARARIAIALLIVSVGIADCAGSNAPSAPTPPHRLHLSGNPRRNPLDFGRPDGRVAERGLDVRLVGSYQGSQFEPGATLKFADQTFSAQVVDSTEIRFRSSGTHSVGTVDVTVTNPGGFSATLPGGYTYTLPDAFDFNGDWIAHAGPEFEIDMRFTIQNHVLVSIACGTNASQPNAVPLDIKNGSFPPTGDDGFSLSGTIVSAQTSFGQVNAPGCGNARWWADKAGVKG